MNVAASVRVFHETLGAGGGGGGGSPGCLRGPGDSNLSVARKPLRAASELFLARRQNCGLCCCGLRPLPLQSELGCHPFAMGSREFWGRVCCFLDRATSGVLVWAAIGKGLGQTWGRKH